MKLRAPILTVLSFLLATSAKATLTAEINIYSPPHCSYSDGRLVVNAMGGAWCGGCMYGYHILWSTGDTTGTIWGVPAGTYWVTVTDDSMNVAYDTLQVAAEDFTAHIDFITMCPDTGTGPEFEGFLRGWSGVLWVDMMVGPGPHSFSGGYTEVLYTDTFNSGPFNWDTAYHIIPPVAWGPPGNWGTISYTDAFGCPGTIDWNVPIETFQYDPVQVLQADGSCTGMNNGQLRLSETSTTYFPFQPVKGLVRSDGLQVAPNEVLGTGAITQYIYRTLNAGDYAYVQRYGAHDQVYPPWLAFLQPWFDGSGCADSLPVTIPDNGSTCGTLQGKAFVDSDENCNFLGSEARIPGMVMEIQPGNHYTITGGQGNYSINLPVGTGYTVTQQTTQYDEHCSGGMAFNVLPGTYVTRDQADTSLTAMDSRIAMGSGPKRPGFQVYYGIDFHNLTATNTGPSTVTVVLDPVLTFVSAIPPPTFTVGNTLTWNYANINGFAYGSIDLWGQLPPDPLLIGDTLTTTVELITTTADADLSNNTYIDQGIITGSFDPNDKSVVPADQFTVGEDSTLTYTIRFQNTGTDTAFLVVVVDTLPEELDPATFEMLAASHPYTLDMQGHGVLRWMFPFILLPDSNTNEAMSHGFVTFRIKPRWPLFPGTAISNAADIFFDFNPPIHTNDAVVVAELSTGQEQGRMSEHLNVFPNPTGGMVTVLSTAGRFHQLELYSSTGQRLAAWPFSGARMPIDLSGMSGGVYLLSARSANGDVHRVRLILH